MSYRIGLDIGIASVGWSVVDCDNNGEPCRIIDLGARVFESAETPKEGKPLAEARRTARGSRRRNRRRVERLRRTKELFKRFGVVVDFKGEDVNILRVKGLDEKLSENDFARILYALCKRRGFFSNRKSDAKEKEAGKLLTAAKNNDELMHNYRTIGEMLVKTNCKTIKKTYSNDTYFVCDIHNHGGEYTKSVFRKDIEQEIDTLFEKQKEFGNKLATDEVKTAFLGKKVMADDGSYHFEDADNHRIFGSQRNYDEGPGKGSPYSAEYKVGKCSFENELRAPKASYSVEWSVALQKLNNLKIINNGNERELTQEQREAVISLMKKQCGVKFKAIRKALKLEDDDLFNVSYPACKGDETPESTIEKFESSHELSSLKRSKEIKDCLEDSNKQNVELLDEIAVILCMAKSDSKRMERFAQSEICKVLSDKEKYNLLGLTPNGFGYLGLTATKKIIPFLEQGFKYSEACEKAGYNHSQATCHKSKYLTSNAIKREIESITSPVVKRSVYQTLRVLNAIIGRYGSPLAINVELARDISKSKNERVAIANVQNSRFEDNQRRREQFKAKFGKEPKCSDLLRYTLYEEQNCKCIYSGKDLDINRIFYDDYCEIDHVLPYSRTYDDSHNNKVLVLTEENRNKGNRTPVEYFNSKANVGFEAFKDRVLTLYSKNLKKKQNLLRENLSDGAEKEFKSRALNDTRYSSRFISNLLSDHLLFDSSVDWKKRVYVYNGQMTAFMRRNWGINKIRDESDFHHAVDATVIACLTDSIRQKVEKWFAYNSDMRYANLITTEKYIIDSDTGEVFGNRMPLPYINFNKELSYRATTTKTLEEIKTDLKNIGYLDEELQKVKLPVVSRMKREKITGQIHDATISSAKKYNEDGIVITKTSLSKLKLTKDKNGIEGYYNPDSDRLLYEALIKRLLEFNGNAEKAFAEPFYKPKSDGTPGNLVRKVKTTSNPSLGVVLNDVNGFSANGGMVRVDVFEKQGKYYGVPVYLIDAYNKVLPNKAATRDKSFDDWDEMDNSYNFVCSLYKNDIIYIESSSEIELKRIAQGENLHIPPTRKIKCEYLYYNSFNINTACVRVGDLYGSYLKDSMGIKTLKTIKKCDIDVLGNITFAPQEERKGF